jgi:uncharacterized protein with LGFP repeats
MRAVQHYHRNTLGWNDIGYNLLVDRYGQVFEGRDGGIDQAVVGAQAQGYNSVSTGIAVIGTHTQLPIDPAALEALAALLAWKLSLHQIPPTGSVTVTSTGGPLNRYPAGRRVTLERIAGHRDGDATECPGDGLYAQLPALRARAVQLAGTTPFSLAVSPTRVDQLVPVTASGRLLLPDGTPQPGAPSGSRREPHRVGGRSTAPSPTPPVATPPRSPFRTARAAPREGATCASPASGRAPPTAAFGSRSPFPGPASTACA